jgi:hypothetical protein
LAENIILLDRQSAKFDRLLCVGKTMKEGQPQQEKQRYNIILYAREREKERESLCSDCLFVIVVIVGVGAVVVCAALGAQIHYSRTYTHTQTHITYHRHFGGRLFVFFQFFVAVENLNELQGNGWRGRYSSYLRLVILKLHRPVR